MEAVLSAVLMILGLVMLCFGGHWLVSGSVAIAKKFRISNLVIGMTVVAYGTSTPEFAASIAAAGEHAAIILGNVVGSNIANVGMVVGISAVLVPLAVSRSVLRREIPIMLGVFLLLVLLSIDGGLSQYDGVLLLGGLGVFAFYTYKNAARRRGPGGTPGEKGGIRLRSVSSVGAGIALLYVGAILTVDNAVVVARDLGLSEKIIGLTVIAIGTSLPELITSVIAIRKGHTDIGIGNIIGSNIYNVLMIMGVGTVLGGMVAVSDAYTDYAIMVAFGASMLVALKTGTVGRAVGACLIAGYAAYMAFTFFM